MSTPKIRFKGFTADWEKRKLSNVVSLFGGNAFSSNDSVDEGARWLKIANVGIGHLKWSERSFLPISYLEKYSSYRLFPGDYVMALTRPILNGELKIAEINDENILLNQRVAKLIFACDKQFGYQLLRKNTTVDSIEHELAGTDPPNLSGSTLSNIDVGIPHIKEQKKMGEYFQTLDELIVLHRRKCDELQKVKKYMLQKMFPKKGEKVPEIRFAGFTGDWEQQKLDDIGETYTGLSGKTKDDFGHGKATFVTYMNVYTNPIADKEKVESVEMDPAQNEVQYGDVFFTTSSETPEEVGMSCVWLEHTVNTYLNSFCFGYRPTMSIDPYYLAYVLRSDAVRKKIIFLAQGISRYNISPNKVMGIDISLPTLKEQAIIGQYFSNLDNLITLHQCKYDALKEIKKYMLQNMFPKK